MATILNNPEIKDLGNLITVGHGINGITRFCCMPIFKSDTDHHMEHVLVGTKFEAVDGTRWFITGCYQPTQTDTQGTTQYVISCVPVTHPTALDRYSKITEPLTTLRRNSDLEWEWEDTGGGCLAIVNGDMTADHGTYTMITYFEGPFTYDEYRDGIQASEPISVGTYPCDDEFYDTPMKMVHYADWFDFILNHNFTTGGRKWK